MSAEGAPSPGLWEAWVFGLYKWGSVWGAPGWGRGVPTRVGRPALRSALLERPRDSIITTGVFSRLENTFPLVFKMLFIKLCGCFFCCLRVLAGASTPPPPPREQEEFRLVPRPQCVLAAPLLSTPVQAPRVSRPPGSSGSALCLVGHTAAAILLSLLRKGMRSSSGISLMGSTLV